MKEIHAIHEVHIKGKVIEAGMTGEVPDDKYAELKKLGAIRDLNDDEKALRSLGSKKSKESEEGDTKNESGDEKSEERKALEERADAAEVKFNKNISDEKLLERVVEAENKKQDPDEL